MNGGLSQDARILRLVDDEYLAERDAADAWQQGREPFFYLDTAEYLQPDYDPPIGDPIGLIQSLGWRRILAAVAFMAIAWGGTAVFAVMCGNVQ